LFKRHGALLVSIGLAVGPLDIFLLMAIPADLFDSVIDNLLEDAYVKRRAESGIEITVTLQSEVGSVCLRVCDQGSAIATARANELFKQPVLSYSGLGYRTLPNR
jgi:K+-sensing histidine kinase KdpD